MTRRSERDKPARHWGHVEHSRDAGARHVYLTATARVTPSFFISVTASSVSGDAYLNARYALWGAVSGLCLSRYLTIISPWASVHFLMGDPPPISAYCAPAEAGGRTRTGTRTRSRTSNNQSRPSIKQSENVARVRGREGRANAYTAGELAPY